VFEETGLVVKSVEREMEPGFEYETVKTVGGMEVRKKCVQINFVVKCEGEEVRVNSEEHSVGIWAGREEIEGLEMTDGMRALVKRAFEMSS
jgi:hypothetical protein